MIEKKLFGGLNGENVYSFFLCSKQIEVEVLNYGGIIRSLKVLKGDNASDVVLGYDHLDGYVNGTCYYGAIIGRCSNRIDKGEFYLNGKKHLVTTNENGNCLHGGISGFDKKIWNYKIEGESLILSLLSPNGDEGFPGNLSVEVKYTVIDGQLVIEYFAFSDKDTVVNLTNHSYFNLNGEGNGDVLKHNLVINALEYTPIYSNGIPTGEIASVKQTPFDFSKEKQIGRDIFEVNSQLKIAGGYDHNYVLSGNGYREIAKAVGDKTGIIMQVFSNSCGVQLYTNNTDNFVLGKNTSNYGKWSAFCLETQFFPDAINHQNFPSPVLKANEKFSAKTTFKFSY